EQSEDPAVDPEVEVIDHRVAVGLAQTFELEGAVHRDSFLYATHTVCDANSMRAMQWMRNTGGARGSRKGAEHGPGGDLAAGRDGVGRRRHAAARPQARAEPRTDRRGGGGDRGCRGPRR